MPLNWHVTLLGHPALFRYGATADFSLCIIIQSSGSHEPFETGYPDERRVRQQHTPSWTSRLLPHSELNFWVCLGLCFLTYLVPNNLEGSSMATSGEQAGAVPLEVRPEVARLVSWEVVWASVRGEPLPPMSSYSFSKHSTLARPRLGRRTQTLNLVSKSDRT